MASARRGWILSALLLFMLLPAVAPTPALSQANCNAFPETGKTVCGEFWQYWQSHGGLAQQGYPISGEMQEVSAIDGKTYTVQYFERERFESHPEKKGTQFEVLLGLLGSELMGRK